MKEKKNYVLGLFYIIRFMPFRKDGQAWLFKEQSPQFQMYFPKKVTNRVIHF